MSDPAWFEHLAHMAETYPGRDGWAAANAWCAVGELRAKVAKLEADLASCRRGEPIDNTLRGWFGAPR